MRIFTVICLTVLPAMLTGMATAFAQDEDARLGAFFQRYQDAHFRQEPAEATELGDHRFDNLLEDLSLGSREGWRALTRQTLEDLPRQVDYARLTRAGQVDFEIFKQSLVRSLWLAENTQPFEQDPRSYTGYLSDSVYMLLSQSSLPKETNIANALARMAQIPRVVAAAKENLRNPVRELLETAIRQNRGTIDFYERGIFDEAGTTPQTEALKVAAAHVAACLKDYQKFLETDLLPQAHGDWRLGPEKFSRKLELELDAGLNGRSGANGCRARVRPRAA